MINRSNQYTVINTDVPLLGYPVLLVYGYTILPVLRYTVKPELRDLRRKYWIIESCATSSHSAFKTDFRHIYRLFDVILVIIFYLLFLMFLAFF